MNAADPYRDGLRLAATGNYAGAIALYEQALTIHPNDERVLFALAVAAKALNAAPLAENFYLRVLSLCPNRPEAVVGLANLYRETGKFSAAEALLNSALMIHAEAPELWLTMGSLKRETGDIKAARVHYREALARRPSYVPALGNLADMLADDGRNEEALCLYEKLMRLDPHNNQAHFNRSILYLSQADFSRGWRGYAARTRMHGKVPAPDHGLARWNGKFRNGKRLLVTGEQGVGDQLMFASLMPDLLTQCRRAGMSILLDCEPRLVPLLARSFPDISVHPWRVECRSGQLTSHYDWLGKAGGADTAIEIGSLPFFLRTEISQFPNPHCYLHPDPDERSRWLAALEHLPHPWVGLCWRSGKLGGGRNIEYAPAEAWATFIRELPGTAVVAQYGAETEEIAALEAASGKKLFVPPELDQRLEIDRTTAFLSALDIVVSAPTAVSWMAAGAGVKTKKLVHRFSWTGFGKNYEPFAPACQNVSAEAAGGWDKLFTLVSEQIRAG